MWNRPGRLSAPRHPRPLAACRVFLRAAVLVALASAVPPSSSGQMIVGAHPKTPFPAHLPRPVQIDVGFYLIDFARISGREETFDIQAYITARYTDPRLAVEPAQRGGEERRFATDEIWTPNFEFANAVEQVKVQNEAALIVDDDGRVRQRFRFAGKFSTNMDLTRFPFDRQTLTVELEAFERQTKDVVLMVNPEHVGKLPKAFVTDWTVHDISARATDAHYPSFGRTASRLVFAIPVSRKSTFYLWRVLLPMTLLVTASWVVYRFDPTNLQPLISTTVAILLNVILFNFSVDFALPKVAYLTFVDSYAVTCLVFMLINVVGVTAVHLACIRQGPDAARALQRRTLWSLPPAFLAATAVEAWYFLRGIH